MELAATNVVVLVTPAADVPGQWVAHCLNIDLVTQGDSVPHAFMMAQEALLQVVEDDLAQGLDPLDRPRAPEECWQLMAETLREGKPVESIEDTSRIKAAVGYLRLAVRRDALPEDSRPPRPPLPEVDLMPPAWQVAALRTMQDAARC